MKLNNRLFGLEELLNELQLLEILSRKSTDSAWLGSKIGSFEAGFQFQFQPDTELIQNLSMRQIILSQETKNRLKGDLKASLIDGVQNGEGVEGLVKRVNVIFDKMKHYELERIARTEVIASANQARQDAWQKNPSIKWKMWLSKFPYDHRVADDSKRLVGQIQDINKLFIDWKTGREVMQPPLRPNDRCVSIPLTQLPNDIVEWKGLQYSNRYLDRSMT